MTNDSLIERIIEDGVSTLSTPELLSLIAHGKSDDKIQSMYRNLMMSGVEDYKKELSSELKDKGTAAIIAALELIDRLPPSQRWKESVTGPKDVLPLVEQYRHLEQEHLIELTFDGGHRLIKIHTICVGIIDNCPAHPREVFKHAIRDNASGIILVHNHPSGRVIASRQDVRMTAEIKKCGRLIGIELLDHIIIGPEPNTYSSVPDEDD